MRLNGRTEPVRGVQLADDFSIVRPTSEAICLGSSDCDDLLSMCEMTDGCHFTCHIAIPDPDEQACVVGSTDTD